MTPQEKLRAAIDKRRMQIGRLETEIDGLELSLREIGSGPGHSATTEPAVAKPPRRRMGSGERTKAIRNAIALAGSAVTVKEIADALKCSISTVSWNFGEMKKRGELVSAGESRYRLAANGAPATAET